MELQTVSKRRNLAGLTERQEAMRKFIRDFWMVNAYAPTIRQIMAACHIMSTASVAHNLGALERKGFIRRVGPERRPMPTDVQHCPTCKCGGLEVVRG